jgi:hypothetical protein
LQNRRRKPGGGRAESAGEASTPAPSAGEVADGEETQVKRKRSRRRRGPRSSAQSEEGVIAEAAPAAAAQAAEEGGRVRRRRRRAPRGASSSNRASNVFVRNVSIFFHLFFFPLLFYSFFLYSFRWELTVMYFRACLPLWARCRPW